MWAMVRKQIRPTTLVLLAILIGLAGSYLLGVTEYEIRTSKVDAPVRLMLVADMHSCWYGKRQRQIVRAIDKYKPDAVMLCGDIADDIISIDNTRILLEEIAGRYPCFYVTGNHEYWSNEVRKIRALFREHGVTVLEGGHVPFSVRGQKLTVCGIDDTESGRFLPQLEAAAAGIAEGNYTVLLAHRPERFAQYAAHGFDLVLSGHAHGGQWRIPWIVKGLYAPNQGFFPAYTGGVYRLENTSMVVSKGLARETTRIPRFYNRVELVVVDLLPQE